ncbi:MAG: hypothetical protein HY842_20345 [Bacteroidetes bacterium]|nr:hypothetical protein [Bacteroidota bacterium]
MKNKLVNRSIARCQVFQSPDFSKERFEPGAANLEKYPKKQGENPNCEKNLFGLNQDSRARKVCVEPFRNFSGTLVNIHAAMVRFASLCYFHSNWKLNFGT